MSLLKWLSENNIPYVQEGNIYVINKKKYYHIHQKNNKIFDEEFKLNISDQELLLISENDIEDVIFLFGSKYYYSNIFNQKLNLLKYIGISSKYNDILTCYLGIHGKYELLNGTRGYSDWCNKAKFLGYSSLGLCEKATLAGCFYFQKSCIENNIKSIIGETLNVILNDYEFEVKLYVKNKEGWKELLRLHKIHNIDNKSKPHIDFKELINKSNLYKVICTDTSLKKIEKHISLLNNAYYQIDFTEFKNDNKDKDRLLKLKNYLSNPELIPPILIQDSYYLDKEDYKDKIILNQIGKIGFQNISSDQYFKSFLDIYSQIEDLHKNNSVVEETLYLAINNVNKLNKECDFILEKEKSYLPRYKFNEEEYKIADNSFDLFVHYIGEGFLKKIKNKEDIYFKRIEYEIEVLKKGKVIDYFLILKDIINFCKSENILSGIGRGSAAGSLVAYLLNIVEVDPIQHGLIFERFLNEARLMKGTLPDIDQDVPSKERQKIIQYIVNKYGENNVAFIGTNQLLKLKSLFKDLLKNEGMSFQDANKITSIINKDYENRGIEGLFELATKEPKLKAVLNQFHDSVELIGNLIMQPRSFGIHAAGIVIVPDENGETVFDSLPTRMVDGKIVTEWEKDTLEDNGYLKLDMLGLDQLDKIQKITNLIKENRGVDVNILEIPLDDPEVYKLFQNGFTEDIFQFNTDGLKQYCKELQPTTIDHLIAANSLYRPGAMGSESHLKYIRVKNGKETPSYYKGSKHILEETYSVMIYQEQVMKICTDLAGFSLKEADDIRKAIGKKNIELLNNYKKQFINNVQKISKYSEEEANKLWEDIEYFGEYSFNRSHSAAYSITGYYTAWLKKHYPLEFYATALGFDKKDKVPNIIQEIKLSTNVSVHIPNINKSESSFKIDFKENSIYWGLLSIKFVGEKILFNLLEERNKNGDFYSFKEFMSRCSNYLNKRVIKNLILSGAFDELCNIKDIQKRIDLLEQVMDSEELSSFIRENNLKSNSSFLIIQKELCGYGDIDYHKMQNTLLISNLDKYDVGQNIQIISVVKSSNLYKYSKGTMCKLLLEQNGSEIECIIWSEIYDKFKDILNNCKKSIVSGNFVVREDSRNGKIQLQSSKFTKINFYN